jgi:DNA-binding NtrC family response regulator
MNGTSNAFWREVLDYLPGLIMLFRIDENEQTHLMFVTQHVKDDLGFTPEEYVLASEQKSLVNKEIEKLIDTIAEMSHDAVLQGSPSCSLTDRNGTVHEYAFDFRVFRTKSSKYNFISVALYPSGTLPQTTASEVVEAVSGPLFVTESPMIKDILTRIDTYSEADLHILFRGESGVGKRTLASMLARKSAVLKADQQVWELDLTDPSYTRKGRIFAGLDEADGSETLFDDISKDLQLVIIEMGRLSNADQKDLLRVIENRNQKGLRTRVIATSTESIEHLMESGVFDASLFYKLSFVTVFVPPAKSRVEDLEAITRQMVRRIAQAIHIAEPEVTSRTIQQLAAMPLKHNFTDVMRILRRSVLSSEGKLTLTDVVSAGLPQKQTNSAKVSEPKKDFEMVPYEVMTKRYLEAVLEHTEGKIYGTDGAAALLRMKPTTLQSKLKKLKIR